MREMDEDDPKRALLTAAGAMALVAVLVGGAVGAVAVGAAKVAGLGEGDGPDEAAPASLFIPEYVPTESADGDDFLGLPTITASVEPTPEPAEETPRGDKVTLFAAPVQASPGQRINLNGVYVDGEGVALRVQRKEGDGWSDFASVTAKVRGGVFETWVQTTRTGEARFRVYDAEADRASNVVVIQIG